MSDDLPCGTYAIYTDNGWRVLATIVPTDAGYAWYYGTEGRVLGSFESVRRCLARASAGMTCDGIKVVRTARVLRAVSVREVA